MIRIVPSLPHLLKGLRHCNYDFLIILEKANLIIHLHFRPNDWSCIKQIFTQYFMKSILVFLWNIRRRLFNMYWNCFTFPRTRPFQGWRKVWKSGRASNNAAGHRYLAAPSILPKSGVGAYAPLAPLASAFPAFGFLPAFRKWKFCTSLRHKDKRAHSYSQIHIYNNKVEYSAISI